MWILIGGNPVDGFSFEGPFDSREAAIERGEELGPDWWIAPLLPPLGEVVLTVIEP